MSTLNSEDNLKVRKQIRNSEATFAVPVQFLICHTISTSHLLLILVFAPENRGLPLHGSGRNVAKNINKNIDQILHNLACVPIDNANIHQKSIY